VAIFYFQARTLGEKRVARTHCPASSEYVASTRLLGAIAPKLCVCVGDSAPSPSRPSEARFLQRTCGATINTTSWPPPCMYFSSCRCSGQARALWPPGAGVVYLFSSSSNILCRLCVLAVDLRVLEACEIDAVPSRIGTLEKSSYFEVLVNGMLRLSSHRQRQHWEQHIDRYADHTRKPKPVVVTQLGQHHLPH
jgi:hypothetical protein